MATVATAVAGATAKTIPSAKLKGPTSSDGGDGDEGIGMVVTAMFKGLSAGGATRHVVAAAAAAVLRTLQRDGLQLLHTEPVVLQAVPMQAKLEPGDAQLESLLLDRLAMIAPALRAQVAAGLLGCNCHSAKGLVEPEVALRANVAKHASFETGDLLSRLPAAELRRRQRGRTQGKANLQANTKVGLDNGLDNDDVGDLAMFKMFKKFKEFWADVSTDKQDKELKKDENEAEEAKLLVEEAEPYGEDKPRAEKDQVTAKHVADNEEATSVEGDVGTVASDGDGDVGAVEAPKGEIVPEDTASSSRSRSSSRSSSCCSPAGRLLQCVPEDQLTFVVKGPGSRSIQTLRLENRHHGSVAFKVMISSRNKFLARPARGTLPPGGCQDVQFTLQPGHEAGGDGGTILVQAVESLGTGVVPLESWASMAEDEIQSCQLGVLVTRLG
jgi:hypothetical protein